MTTPGVWDELTAMGAVRSFNTEEHLIRWQDGDPGGLLAIVDGLCKVCVSTAEGREVLVAVRGVGEIVGELSALTGSVPSASVVALTPVRAAIVDRAAFDEWLDNTEGAGRRLATMLAERIVENTRLQVGTHQRVDVRLADRILYLSDRFVVPGRSAPRTIEVPLTHDDYAAWVGATRAVATRALGALRDRGHIDFGRGWIDVCDRAGLERFVLET